MKFRRGVEPRQGANRTAIAALILAVFSAPLARADTLSDAIALAYQTNPTLRAQRAELRAVDEGYVQAEANAGPQVTLSGGVSAEAARVALGAGLFGGSDQENFSGGTTTTTLSAAQSLYTSGLTSARLHAASADIVMNRQLLRQAESQTLLQVITAYLDVGRDRAAVHVIEEELAALKDVSVEVQARGKLGQISKTDVAQAEERILAAQAQYNVVLGRLTLSEAEYLNVVGENPGVLEPASDLPGAPQTVEAAFDSASSNNPRILASAAGERGARERVNAAKAANGPTVSVRVDANVGPTEPYLQHSYEKSAAVSLIYNAPLFSAGLNQSKIRQALEEDNRAMLELEAERRNVVQAVSQAWTQLMNTKTATNLAKRQIASQRAVVKGDQIEERVGERSTVELLNAELELTNAELNLLQLQHDEVLAQASLLSAAGLLQADLIAPQVKSYDPSASFRQVERRTFDPLRPLIAATETIAGPKTAVPDLIAARQRPDAAGHLPSA